MVNPRLFLEQFFELYFIPNEHNIIHMQNNTTAMTIYMRAYSRPPKKLNILKLIAYHWLK